MGRDAQATLFYGYCWNDSIDLLGEDHSHDEWPEIILQKRGVINPYDTMPADNPNLSYSANDVATHN